MTKRFTLFVRYFYLTVFILLAVVLYTGCTTSLSVIHNPLYRAAPHTSEITATAKNSSVGIEKISITVTTGEMTDCTELGVPPSMIPCRRNASTIVHECNFAGSPSTATCTYSQSLGNQSIVTYSAVAEPVSGSSRSTSEITYSGGFPPTAGIARPVWWHRGDPLAGKIDIGYFPDADYMGLYTEFTDDIQVIILGSFFNSSQNLQKHTLFFVLM